MITKCVYFAHPTIRPKLSRNELTLIFFRTRQVKSSIRLLCKCQRKDILHTNQAVTDACIRFTEKVPKLILFYLTISKDTCTIKSEADSLIRSSVRCTKFAGQSYCCP